MVFRGIPENRVYCKCGHSITDMTPKHNYVTCSWCGRLVFKNKKAEFDYRLAQLKKANEKSSEYPKMIIARGCNK